MNAMGLIHADFIIPFDGEIRPLQNGGSGSSRPGPRSYVGYNYDGLLMGNMPLFFVTATPGLIWTAISNALFGT